MLDSALGVFKSYSTRVGTGPFPTELSDDTGRLIQQRGSEFGTVTGRPRRCGWLDLVALAYAVRLNGTKYLAMTKVDVLSGLDPVRVCVAYNLEGSETKKIPARRADYERATPVYEDVKGWRLDTPSESDPHRSASEILPAALLDYIALIERSVGSKTALVSLGPDRSETVFLDKAIVSED
jgi:adenylosuccinate synthase